VKGRYVVHSCWSVMRNLFSFHVYVNLEVFVSDKFGPHIPAAAFITAACNTVHVVMCLCVLAR